MVSENRGKSSKSKTKKGGSSSGGGATPEKLKTVVRRLPPNLPEEIFWQSVQSWVTEETVTWKQYHQGKIRKRYNKENIPSRAYVAFKNAELLATFSQAYDGHIFRDKAGTESRAVVEFAPFQKVPTEKKKADARVGTIEQDEDYISFINTLNAPTTKLTDAENLEALVASTQAAPEVKTTPLLEALLAEKSAAKDKEAILRNHAHYRDSAKRDKGKGPILVPPGSSRGGRGAVVAPAAAAGASEGHGHSGKRARRGKNKDDAKDAGDGGATPKGPNQNQSKAAASSANPALPAPMSRRQRERERAREKAAAIASAAASSEPSGTSAATPIPAATTTIALITDDLPGDSPSTPTPASATQRRRPALGLQSRHFEAALSGVVPGGPRPPRRERREKEKEVNTSAGAEGATTSTTGNSENAPGIAGSASSGTGGERKVSDGSRSRKRDKGDKGAKDTPTSPPPKILRRESVSSATTPAGIISVKLPSASTTGTDGRSTSPFDTPVPAGRGRGERGRGGSRGGRRARGRGRGRGDADGGGGGGSGANAE